MNRSALATLTAFAALGGIVAMAGCVAQSDQELASESVGSTAQPIIGGTEATGYPEAALVDIYQNGSLYAWCSGSVIAPNVVLTAGHCAFDSNAGTTWTWKVTAPFANGQTASATSSATYDWNSTGEDVDPNEHDIGLIFLGTPITLASYPALAAAPVADNTAILEIGRINNGTLSKTALYAGPATALSASEAQTDGYPFDYESKDVIQSGDSGGPDEIPSSSPHTIVSVNSGAGGGTQVLARVDLVKSWIDGEVTAHGGSGAGTDAGTGSADAGGAADAGGRAADAGAGTADAGSGHPTCASPITTPNTYETPYALGASACGTLETSTAQDWFDFKLNKEEAYDLQLTATGDANILLWKVTNRGYVQVANTSPTQIEHTASGSYVAVVYSPGGQVQSYTLTRE